MKYPIDSFELIVVNLLVKDSDDVIDLRPFVKEIAIKESMSDMFVTGSITVQLEKGILSSKKSFPKAQDILSFSIKSMYKIPTEDVASVGDDSITGKANSGKIELGGVEENEQNIEGDFVIYNIQKVESLDPSVHEMKLNFISREGIKDKTVKVQKSYRKKKRVETIQQIYSDFLEVDSTLNAEVQDENEFTCIIPNWSPSYSIHWLLSGCVKDKDKNFLIFQRFKDGKIETKLDTFFNVAKKEPIVGTKNNPEYGFIESIDTTRDINEEKNFKMRLRMVTDVTRIQRLNTLEWGMAGTWASKAFFYDITRKKYLKGKEVNNGKGEFSYKDDAEEPKVDDYKKFVSDDFLNENDFYVTLIPKAQYRFHEDEEKEGVDRTEEWYLEHISQVNLNNFFTLNITSIGDTNVSIGETVTYCNLIGDDFEDENEPLQLQFDTEKKELGGTYILWSLERIFTTPQANQSAMCKNVMTLVRDGWSQ